MGKKKKKSSMRGRVGYSIGILDLFPANKLTIPLPDKTLKLKGPICCYHTSFFFFFFLSFFFIFFFQLTFVILICVPNFFKYIVIVASQMIIEGVLENGIRIVWHKFEVVKMIVTTALCIKISSLSRNIHIK